MNPDYHHVVHFQGYLRVPVLEGAVPITIRSAETLSYLLKKHGFTPLVTKYEFERGQVQKDNEQIFNTEFSIGVKKTTPDEKFSSNLIGKEDTSIAHLISFFKAHDIEYCGNFNTNNKFLSN